MPGWYLAALLVSLAGLASLDFRYKLAFFHNWLRTAATLLVALIAYLIWDLIGVSGGVFFEGKNNLMLGINLLPQIPLEEPIFLILLSYTILLVYRFWEQRSGAARERGR
jgi:lycopene cyclase domain-containing protein